MRIKTAAFVLLLLAGAAPAALAQTEDQGRRPQERERPMRPDGEPRERGDRGGGRGGGHEAPQPAPAAPQARPAPTAPQAQAPRGDRGQGGGRWAGGEGSDARGGASPAARPELRDQRSFNGGRADPGARDGRWEGDRRSAEAPRDDRRDNGRQADRRRDDNRWAGNGGDRRNDGGWSRGDRNPGNWRPDDRRDRSQWRPGVYPRSFYSAYRYHARPYVRPPRFYVRVWNFGEILPPAWFGPEYVIGDWWNYDLPPPPFGYDWVRVGDDALLVDGYSGRIVQVIRQLFW